MKAVTSVVISRFSNVEPKAECYCRQSRFHCPFSPSSFTIFLFPSFSYFFSIPFFLPSCFLFSCLFPLFLHIFLSTFLSLNLSLLSSVFFFFSPFLSSILSNTFLSVHVCFSLVLFFRFIFHSLLPSFSAFLPYFQIVFLK